MSPKTWVILGAALIGTTLGCGGGEDPQVVMEMNCAQCGKGEDVQAGCEACQAMADSAINQTRPDIGKARSLYAQACDVHHPPSCNELAKMCRDGRGGPRDVKRAATLFTIACEGGDIQSACTEVGISAYDGVGMKKDQEKGVALFEAACFHETDARPKACAALGLAPSLLSAGGDARQGDRAVAEVL